jgi:uncharacterized protein (TIGR03437 family)
MRPALIGSAAPRPSYPDLNPGKELPLILKNTLNARFVPFLVLPILFQLTPILTASTPPQLMLDQTSVTVSTVQGSNGPTQFLDAFNVGEGTLSLTATSNVTWLSATIGTSQVCGLLGGCFPLEIALNTSSLANGVYTGIVTVTDPNAINSPQSITVTVMVGGDVPGSLVFNLAPGGSTSSSFTTGSAVTTKVSADTSWLTVTSATSQGVTTVTVQAKTSSTMAANAYKGTITISGSKFAPDNKQISVVLNVTTEPIAQVSNSNVSFTIPQSANKQSSPVAVTNAGQGTLTVSGVTASAANSGTWLTASSVSGGLPITADPTGLSAGTYTGTVTIASNAINNSVVIPVQLTVEAQTPPLAFAGGAVNNGTFANGEPLAQGDIVAVFGSQFTYGDAQGATTLPLQTTINGVQVLVNGKAAPLFYVGAGQINFEVPIDAATGSGTIQVVRNSTAGNLISVDINPRVPRFIVYGGGYGVVTQSNGATLTGTPSTQPLKAGDVIVIYAIGLGPTSPAVTSGTGSPGSPGLATVPGTTKVCFGDETPFYQAPCATASFTGLTPDAVALYQITATVPEGLTSADNKILLLLVDNIESTPVTIAVQ